MDTTLGIDLASQPANTGLCVVEWSGRGGRVHALARGNWNGAALRDEVLLDCILDSSMTAIDAPFGWPEPFVDAVARHRDGEPWPARLDEPDRSRFVRRATDTFVSERAKMPLAVSADRIAYPAMRCAALLSALAPSLTPEQLARDGSGIVCEAYPDAALRRWLPALWEGARPDSYKGDAPTAHVRRDVLLTGLLDGLGPRFSLTCEQGDACRGSDDVLDALVCALLARAAALRLTIPAPDAAQRSLAAREGWIHLPRDGTLAQLV